MTDPTTEHRGMQAGNIPLIYKVKSVLGLTAAYVVGDPIPLADRENDVDISHYNPVTNYNLLRSMAGAVYCKAVESNWYYDNTFDANRNGLNGSVWGGYAFLRNIDGVSQADWWWNKVGSVWGWLPPCADIEVPMPVTVILAWGDRMMHWTQLSKLVGYMSSYTWGNVTGTTRDKQTAADMFDLYIAHYQTDRPYIPIEFASRSPQYVMHQWNPNGNGPSYGVSSLGIDEDHGRISWVQAHRPGRNSWEWDMTNEARRNGWTVRDPE